MFNWSGEGKTGASGVGGGGGSCKFTRRTIAAAPPSPNAASQRVLEMGNVF